MRIWLHEHDMHLWLDDIENNRGAIPGKQGGNEGLVYQATVSVQDIFWMTAGETYRGFEELAMKAME